MDNQPNQGSEEPRMVFFEQQSVLCVSIITINQQKTAPLVSNLCAGLQKIIVSNRVVAWRRDVAVQYYKCFFSHSFQDDRRHSEVIICG